MNATTLPGLDHNAATTPPEAAPGSAPDTADVPGASSPPGVTYKDRHVGADLGSLLREFIRHPSPWMLLVSLASSIVLRARLGEPRLSDVVTVAALIAAQPFTEWLIHVGVLHFRPRQLGRVRIDLHLATEHRAHHRAPHVIRLVMIPWIDLAAIVLVANAIGWSTQSAPFAAAMVVASALALQYEWTHFLLHSPRRFRSARYQRLERHHRLHHFRNEHYWMGVTTTAADRVLHTNPARGAVPLSPTARSLDPGDAGNPTREGLRSESVHTDPAA
jgi:hypothetical protein